ncbi:8-oxo-dGTP diphosphatase [bacterium BMS3Bbin12]|nr:8-oxo-dGTP diphosphatase [bacterium BMS3Bbin12]GBE51526.1 8-oxo-dGTP diphosphatase [bacterium BMS3Bbin13]
MMESIHVAAAAILDARGRVLIARRAPDAPQGGLWEFPGGKLEPGESVEQALHRELDEELGIGVEDARPLIRIRHAYPDRTVLLDVWRVDRYRGTPSGRQGQPLEWVLPQDPGARVFPAADRPVLTALRLPDRYLITPEPGPDAARFLDTLERRVASGAALVRLRARSQAPDRFRWLAAEALERCRRHGARLLINGPADLARELAVDGVHLTAHALGSLSARPLPEGYWVGASCHDAAELRRAAHLGVDFAVLSPVRSTPSHPDARALGWEEFAKRVDPAPFPVYALGGVGPRDLESAFRHGAQGIAAIRGLWNG